MTASPLTTACAARARARGAPHPPSSSPSIWRSTLLVALLTLAACSGSQQAPEPLYFSNWEGEIGDTTLADFAAHTGIPVETEEIVSNVSLQTKLMTGNSGTDVAVPSSNFLEPLIAAGALTRLDKSKLPNWKHLDPAWLARLARMDPGNEYGVPYLWGIHAFGYDIDKVTAALGRAPPQSWSLVFDPEIARRLAPCGIAWQDSAGSIMTKLALLGLGLDPTSEKPEDLAAAEAAFMRVRPYVRYLDSTVRTRTELASGDLCVAISANGDVLTARDIAREARTGANLRFVVPDEGALLWADLLVIPANAPHPDAAHRFIDFMLRPDVIAKVTNDSKYANANRDATRLVAPLVRDDPDVYPPADTMARLHLLPADTPQYTRARTRMWTRVRTAPTSYPARRG